MKKIIVFFALFFQSATSLHCNFTTSETDFKQKIVIVGDDLTALWSAYFLMQEIETRGSSDTFEIDLIGENLNLQQDRVCLMPMMMSGNISSMLKEEWSREEIQNVISLQSRNQRLVQSFLSEFDQIDSNQNRLGSYLALHQNSDPAFYLDGYFSFKLPLTLCQKNELPLKMRYLFSSHFDLFYAPFDSLVDEVLLRKLLLSKLLEERAEKPQINLHLTSCEKLVQEGESVTLELTNGEIIHTNICVIDLENTTLPLIEALLPDNTYEPVLEAILFCKGIAHNPRQPYFVQFPSVDLSLTIGKDQNLYFYRKLVGLCHDEVKIRMIEQAQNLHPRLESLEFKFSTFYRPIEKSTPILYPFGCELPIIVINQDQSERISQGAALGELSRDVIAPYLH